MTWYQTHLLAQCCWVQVMDLSLSGKVFLFFFCKYPVIHSIESAFLLLQSSVLIRPIHCGERTFKPNLSNQ